MADATVIRLTEFQRKRIAQGRSVPVLRQGVWYKIVPANKGKVQKIKNQLAALRAQLKTEMAKRTKA